MCWPKIGWVRIHFTAPGLAVFFSSVIPIFIWHKKPSSDWTSSIIHYSPFKTLNNSILPDHRSTMCFALLALFLLEFSLHFHWILKTSLFSQFINLFWFHLSFYPGQTPVSMSSLTSPLSSTNYRSALKLEHFWRKLRSWCVDCLPCISVTARCSSTTAWPPLIPHFVCSEQLFHSSPHLGTPHSQQAPFCLAAHWIHQIWTPTTSPFHISISDSTQYGPRTCDFISFCFILVYYLFQVHKTR